MSTEHGAGGNGLAGERPHGRAAAPVNGAHEKTETRGKRGLRIPRRFRKARPGSVAGIEPHDLAHLPTQAGGVRITCIDFCQENVLVQDVRDTPGFVAQHRPPWSAVRWIDVDGLADMVAIRSLAEKYHLHPLAIEDLLHVPQRPKVDPYPGDGEFQARMFIIARMLQLQDERLHSEQISIFLGHRTVLTFQETPGDIWDPIRQRLQTAGSLLRAGDASFLVYSLIDAIVDQCFPILEHYGDRLEEIENLVLDHPKPEVLQEIHRVKRELLLLRRGAWPMREIVHRLQREPHECFSEAARAYMRDVYDHSVQIIDIMETYREVAIGLTETYMSSMSNHMNEIMKVLTIIGTIFIPLTFLAGVYGMNFRHLPELAWRWSYAGFWAVCLATAVFMLAWFRRKKWF